MSTEFRLRGPANDWFDAVSVLLRQSKEVRLWFAKSVLFEHSERFSEYLLESPSAEVSWVKPLVTSLSFVKQEKKEIEKIRLMLL